jgi:hypothetical protein
MIRWIFRKVQFRTCDGWGTLATCYFLFGGLIRWWRTGEK